MHSGPSNRPSSNLTEDASRSERRELDRHWTTLARPACCLCGSRRHGCRRSQVHGAKVSRNARSHSGPLPRRGRTMSHSEASSGNASPRCQESCALRLAGTGPSPPLLVPNLNAPCLAQRFNQPTFAANGFRQESRGPCRHPSHCAPRICAGCRRCRYCLGRCHGAPEARGRASD